MDCFDEHFSKLHTHLNFRSITYVLSTLNTNILAGTLIKGIGLGLILNGGQIQTGYISLNIHYTIGLVAFSAINQMVSILEIFISDFKIFKPSFSISDLMGMYLVLELLISLFKSAVKNSAG